MARPKGQRQGPRRVVPDYECKPLTLTERQRIEYAHRLWQARRTMLLVAPLLRDWQTQILAAAKSCTEVVDLMVPEPRPQVQPDDE